VTPGEGSPKTPVEEPEGVLSPEELGVESSEHVDTLDENRYVVTGDSEPVELSDEFREKEQADEYNDDVSFVEQAGTPFAVEMAVKTTNGVDEIRLKGKDITGVFEAVSRWYADQLEPDLPPETVLELVLNESEMNIEAEATAPE
jgi:hypothetical protein